MSNYGVTPTPAYTLFINQSRTEFTLNTIRTSFHICRYQLGRLNLKDLCFAIYALFKISIPGMDLWSLTSEYCLRNCSYGSTHRNHPHQFKNLLGPVVRVIKHTVLKYSVHCSTTTKSPDLSCWCSFIKVAWAILFLTLITWAMWCSWMDPTFSCRKKNRALPWSYNLIEFTWRHCRTPATVIVSNCNRFWEAEIVVDSNVYCTGCRHFLFLWHCRMKV